MRLKTIALIVSAIASFLTPFTGSATNVALPPIGLEFNADAITLGWIVTSFLLAAGIFAVPFGRLADIKGRKRVFAIGLLIFTLGSFLSAISPSANLLIAFRAFQGIGGAMIFATAVAILTSIFPPAERGKAIGINIAAVYVGLSLGPFIGGYLTQNFGWRSVFFVNVPIGIFALALALWKLKGEWAEAKEEKFDIIGSIIYGFTLLLITLGLTEFRKAFLIIGAILLIAFVIYESKIEFPVLEMRLFRKNLAFSLSNLAAFITYSSTFAVSFLLSLYLQYIKGLNPQQAGIILLSQPVVMAMLSPFAGWLSDRIEPRLVASLGILSIILSLFAFSRINASTSLKLVVLYLIILGFGLGLFSSPNTNAVMNSVERKFFGIASATVATMRLIGQLFSMAIAMLILSILIGRIAIAPENYALFIKSLETAFTAFTALCFIGLFASLSRGRVLNTSLQK